MKQEILLIIGLFSILLIAGWNEVVIEDDLNLETKVVELNKWLTNPW